MDDWDDIDDPGFVPDLTAWPTDDEPEPVLYLHDGTPLYRQRQPFGFARPDRPLPTMKAKAARRRRTR